MIWSPRRNGLTHGCLGNLVRSALGPVLTQFSPADFCAADSQPRRKPFTPIYAKPRRSPQNWRSKDFAEKRFLQCQRQARRLSYGSGINLALLASFRKSAVVRLYDL